MILLDTDIGNDIDDALTLAHPGEVTIVAIGPLTNLGALFQADPSLPPLLKSLVLMGRRYFTEADQPEWNIRNDPEAAAIVFGSAVPHLRAVGIDVTRQVFMPGNDFRAHCSGILLDFAGPWLERRDRVTFHDPLAAATIFESLCGYQKGFVNVLEDGTTTFREDEAGPHEIAVTVDAAGFFAHHLSFIS